MRTIKTISNQSICIILLAVLCNISAAKIIYVDDDAKGANNGSNWVDAYVYLQDALVDVETADKPVEIRVAQGTYTPDKGAEQTSGDREATFHLINGVTITGGYSGATDPNSRDIELYETILSGDLDDNDITWEELLEIRALPHWAFDEPNREDNTYHVVNGSGTNETAALDGFTIDGGAAYHPKRSGGGIYINDGSPTVKNCTLTRNIAGDCGGGVSCENNSNPILINCSFLRNWTIFGGGMANTKSNPSLTNCTFTDNFGANTGEYIYGKPPITSGGMDNLQSNPTLINCRFIKNLDVGMLNIKSSPTLINCSFTGNTGIYGGGILNESEGNPILTNCTFSGNSARYGGGMHNRYYSSPNLTNCTFAQNSAEYGNALSCSSFDQPSNFKLTNCILWNGGNEIWNNDNSTIMITYSNIQGGWPGEGNIDIDPLFANPGYWADANDTNIIVEPNDPNAVWVDGDYHLKSQAGRWDPNTQSWVVDDVTSPCIDAGDLNSPVGEEPFYNGGRINMGAYGGTSEASKSYLDESLIVDVNEQDDGGKVVLEQDQILVVTLESNPSTGYRWEVVENQDSILEQIGEAEYKPSEQTDPPIAGAGGWEIFRFKTVSAGQMMLTLIYRRSWETDVEPVKTFSIEVSVN